jgi:predicted RNase H-like nuclease (RuvC/YqgF family)
VLIGLGLCLVGCVGDIKPNVRVGGPDGEDIESAPAPETRSWDDCEDKLREAHYKIAVLKRDNEDLRREIDDLKDEIDDLEDECKRYKKERDRYKDRYDDDDDD